MLQCEMCGKQQATLKAAVEGTVLAVCDGCSKYGKVIGRVYAAVAASRKKEEKQPAPQEDAETVVANLGQLLKQKRESLGMRQEEFANKIAVKESILHKIETGTFRPGVEEAKRLEKALGLKLVEKAEDDASIVPQAKKDQLTLGDMIKIRKK